MSSTDEREDGRLWAELAVWQHLRALGVEDLPVRWALDAESGWQIVFGKNLRARTLTGSASALSTHYEEADGRLRYELGLRSGRNPDTTPTPTETLDGAIADRAFQAAWDRSETDEWGRAWQNADARALGDSRTQPAGDAAPTARAREQARGDTIRSVKWGAQLAALGGPRGAGRVSLLSVDAWRVETWRARQAASTWGPLRDAIENGLWLFWVTLDEVVAVPRPRVSSERGQLHREGGPAVEWSGGARYFFHRGVEVPEHVVLRPDAIDLREIFLARNVELRRILIERYGSGRFLEAAHARLVDEDPRVGALYRHDMDGDEPIVMVKVRNSTPEPDGSTKDYWLRVPPNTRTARQAVAWTFALDEGAYAPVAET